MGGLAALLAGVGMVIAVVHSALFPPKPPSRNFADGTYRNKDCGSIAFRDGTATFGSTSVTYTLEQQKDGVSATSAHLIGVERDNAGCRVVYDATRYPMYLSFGRDTPPNSVQLWDIGQSVAYDFAREPEKSKPVQGSARSRPQ
ncbi:MAG: hypothetical protein ABIS51_14180 [Sphingomonas sp.]